MPGALPARQKSDKSPSPALQISLQLGSRLPAYPPAGWVSCSRTVAPSGHGAARHAHPDEDEAIFVLSGLVFVEAEGCGGTRSLGPGAFALVPRGKAHALYNPGGNKAHLLVFSAQQPRLELLFVDLHKAMVLAGGVPAPGLLDQIAAHHGTAIRFLAS